ncbi:MAG: aspartyl protease family protein [Spirochaetaceae bacterium]|jgi:predicted aspartyl protease|nr:aspartyl protease family protein [Spirochaetaceae bacterium]
MGMVFADIVIRNAVDVYKARYGFISQKDVRAVSTRALVDTGATTMIIPESTRKELGLAIESAERVDVVGGEESAMVAEPVEIQWMNRSSFCRPWVIKGEQQALLGAIPMEEMDVIVHPAKECLVGAHGDSPCGMVK